MRNRTPENTLIWTAESVKITRGLHAPYFGPRRPFSAELDLISNFQLPKEEQAGALEAVINDVPGFHGFFGLPSR